MVWVEAVVWKVGVKITCFLLLYFVSGIATKKILFQFLILTK